MSSGLGYRNNNENLPRARAAPAVQLSATPAAPAAKPAAKPVHTAVKAPAVLGGKGISVPKGFLPTLLYAAFFFAFPVLDKYVDYDFTETPIRIGVITSSVLAAVIILGANDCVAWFNMALGFHIGVEVGVIDTLMDYARADERENAEGVLAWTAVAVIVIHLLPFVLMDNAKVMMVLGAAGIVVNATALVFVDSSSLLLAGLSSSVLLASVLLVACIDCVRTSIISQLRLALANKTLLTCAPYEM
tara:strand:- start:374 stop:1111 length:738 start_codon:yes stop_codon:yes gene_type:complete